MFPTFLFRSALRGRFVLQTEISGKKKFVFLKNKYISVISSFCCLFYQARHLRRWDQSAVNILNPRMSCKIQRTLEESQVAEERTRG